MFDRVCAVIKSQLGLQDLNLTPDTQLLSDLGINSLELVELVCAFEAAFDLEVPDKDMAKFMHVRDIVNYLEARV